MKWPVRQYFGRFPGFERLARQSTKLGSFIAFDHSFQAPSLKLRICLDDEEDVNRRCQSSRSRTATPTSRCGFYLIE